MTIESTNPSPPSNPTTSPWWNFWTWLNPSQTPGTPGTPDFMQQQLLLQGQAQDLFQGTTVPNTSYPVEATIKTPMQMPFYYLFLLQMLKFLSFLKYFHPPVSQTEPVVDNRQFLQLDSNNEFVIHGTSAKDDIILKKDVEFGTYFVEVNGVRFDIRPEDLAKAEKFVVNGHDGNDTIDFSEGESDFGMLQLYGGAGDDTLTGSAGGDYISGGEGKDSISAGAGNDMVHVRDGEDELSIDGGDGMDTLQGNEDGTNFEVND